VEIIFRLVWRFRMSFLKDRSFASDGATPKGQTTISITRAEKDQMPMLLEKASLLPAIPTRFDFSGIADGSGLPYWTAVSGTQ
jgi:hypothetical protein